ncbi:MAG TPA: ABC transporter permease [Rhizomicrobium sp.]|nr:ABC transporter permease [Rhizomicrobium sp.]
MWRDWLLRAAQFIGSLAGVVVLASLLSALSLPSHDIWSLLSAFGQRLSADIHGDFGRSAVSGMPAMAEVFAVLPPTLQLVAAGAVLAFLLGVPLGIFLSASRTLRAVAPLMQIIAATPVFVAALALIWIAVRVLHWREIPQPSILSFAALMRAGDWNTALHAFALPALTVGAAGAASVQLSLRRSATIAWSEPYRTGLRLMGLGTLDIDLRYAFPEVFAALLRDLGEVMLALISATAVAEWVFDRDGVAVLFLKSAALGDWTVVAAALLIFATITLVFSLLGGIASRLIVPETNP